MKQVDPDLNFARALYTNGHEWKLFEIHENFVKKTKFFVPKPSMARYDEGQLAPRFFDDYEHMLSIVGLLRFALWIRENIVENAENIELIEPDVSKSISQVTFLKKQQNQIIKQIPFERRDVPPALEPGSKDRLKLGYE